MSIFAINEKAPELKKNSTEINLEKSDVSLNKPLNTNDFPLHRKTGCACGGECPACQAKSAGLPISEPSDAAEIEADRIAGQVMRMSENESESLNHSTAPAKFLPARLAPVVQPKGGGGATVGGAISGKIISSQGGGDNLDSGTKSFMQNRFGADFGNVKIHTDREAVQLNRDLNAKAFTVGQDIYFNEGQYQPRTESGKHLLAHELAHVVQQRSGLKTKIMRIPDESGINDNPPRYSYSTNCGWIDWSHANPGMTRRLIRAVQDASDRMKASGSTTPESVSVPRMEANAPIIGLLSGVTPIVHIKKTLTGDEVLSVALRIFMLQSLGFEALQRWTDSIGKSSFSEEDLPSNLIAFYMAARGFNRAKIESLCDVWDAARSLTKFQGYNFRRVGQFRPLRSTLPAGGVFPADLETITPAVTGGALMDFPDALFETATTSFNRELFGYEVIHDPNLHIESLSGGTTVDISGTTPGSANGPHFEVKPLPSGHNLKCRWVIKAPDDSRIKMLGDDGSDVFRKFGTQFNAFINAPSRKLLRDSNITDATILCRVIVGDQGSKASLYKLLELPVKFTW